MIPNRPDKRNPFPAVLLLAVLMPWSTAAADPSAYSTRDLASLLGTHVNEQGLVDYAALKTDRALLHRYVQQVADLDPDTVAGWAEHDQFAFWMNTYNALTLLAVVDHYPVKSIKDIGSLWTSVWDKLHFTVLGTDYTLNQIEHDVLRPRFRDPRLHMAINCASVGCPPLGREPLDGDRLDEQFAALTRRFLQRPTNFRFDARRNRVYLSAIFKWFGEDFVPQYQDRRVWLDLDAAEAAALNFVLPHLDKRDRELLSDPSRQPRVKYLPYDWALNRQMETTR